MSKVDDLTTETINRLKERRGRLVKELSSVVMGSCQWKNLAKKVDKTGVTLRRFENILAKMPDVFVLQALSVQRRSPAGRKKMRDEFNKGAKGRFIFECAKHDVNALQAMGMSMAQIHDMKKKGGVPAGHNKKPLFDITVDHDIDLSLGGTNKDNFRLVPYHVNALRNLFIHAQYLEQDELPDELLILRFKGKQRVPIFKSGFRSYDQSMKTTIQRIKDDFDISMT